MFYCVFILTDLKSEFCDVITYLFFLFLNLQIACVIVPIGQKAHHVLGLKKIITIRPIRSDVTSLKKATGHNIFGVDKHITTPRKF